MTNPPPPTCSSSEPWSAATRAWCAAACSAKKAGSKIPTRSATAKISGGAALCVFERVPSGVFGASAFHDENSNGKLDTNFIGLPTEEYCASRNARGSFGPPSFDDAKFLYKGGLKRIEARMK
ncbi:MAG: DUF2141 domain-containing protein [Polyangiaceae bacterium]